MITSRVCRHHTFDWLIREQTILQINVALRPASQSRLRGVAIAVMSTMMTSSQNRRQQLFHFYRPSWKYLKLDFVEHVDQRDDERWHCLRFKFIFAELLSLSVH